MVTEVINYHRNNGSSVYMCMLDASKAFHRVNLLTLFKTLYSRGQRYGISNLMKYIIFMSLGEKQCLHYGVYHTHCKPLRTINNSLPIEISMEKRSVKSILSCVNSENVSTLFINTHDINYRLRT